MNRRTFFTSLASLGASPALGVGPALATFHTVSNIESPWASASASQIIEDIRQLAARCNTREEPRPFSVDAPYRTEWSGYWLPENVHLFPQQLAVFNEPPRRSIPVLSPRR